MIPFEVHITGDLNINKELDELNIKNIIVDLLKPDRTLLRTEHMSSFVVKSNPFEIGFIVNDLLKKLESDIIRVKIEMPPIKEFYKYSLYMDSHFDPFNNRFPISQNYFTKKFMATDREYDSMEYDNFIRKWDGKHCELCVYDSYIQEDFDWFDLYKRSNLIYEEKNGL